VGGVISARQRPPTARGVAFIALEDEGGVANVILRPEMFAMYREVLRSRFVVIEGVLQWQGRVCGVVGERVLAIGSVQRVTQTQHDEALLR